MTDDNPPNGKKVSPSNHSGSENAFVKTWMPLAERMAKWRAAKYCRSDFRTQLDYDAFISVAAQTLLEVAKKNDTNSQHENASHLCSVAITRRMIDLERQVIGRRGKKKITPRAFSDMFDTTDSNYSSHVDAIIQKSHPVGKSHTDLELRDVAASLKTRLREILGGDTTKYRSVCAMIDYGADGYLQEEIAVKVGMTYPQLLNSLSMVRKKLREQFPEIESEIVSQLLGGSDRGR